MTGRRRRAVLAALGASALLPVILLGVDLARQVGSDPLGAVDAPLGPAEREVQQRGLPGHERGQPAYLGKVYGWMEAHSILERARALLG